jgi:hypothetical protein
MRLAREVLIAVALVCLSAALLVGQEAEPPKAPSSQEVQKTQEPGQDSQGAKELIAMPLEEPPPETESEGKDASKPVDKAAGEQALRKFRDVKNRSGAKGVDAPIGPIKPNGKLHSKRFVPSPPSASSSEPKKVVVRQGGAAEPSAQIVTGMTLQEAIAQRQDAEKSLDAADENLRRLLGRPLDAQQEETVSQIHNYMGRARSALREGDISRGHTLAVKANLLAEDLVKY